MVVLTCLGITLWLPLRAARWNCVLNQNSHSYVLRVENILVWHSGASQNYHVYEMQLFLRSFFGRFCNNSVQACDNSASSLDLICKCKFDPYQLQWKLFILHGLDKVKYVSQVLAENTGN